MTQPPNPNAFLDLDIHIAARREHAYPVHICMGGEQDFDGTLSADVLPWSGSGDPARNGQRLFAMLFADPDLRRAWDIACGKSPHRRRIRLWIDPDAPELHTLPWECLHDGNTWLAASAARPFSRYLPSDEAWGGLVEKRPIRILSVITNPADLARYNLAALDVAAERGLLTTTTLGDLVPDYFALDHIE